MKSFSAVLLMFFSRFAGLALTSTSLVAIARHTIVLVLASRMPELDGVSAIREIRSIAPATRILVLTTYDSDGDILRAVEAGATGYLLKDTPREELFKAIRATARGISNKIIGKDLRISEATVKTHLLHIFAKLGVDDRTAAVTAAMERGMLRTAR